MSNFKTSYMISNSYKDLDKDCMEYKALRLKYLDLYRWAIERDYFWTEKHYFKKLLTCIRYDNFSPKIVAGLHKVFAERAKYLSWYLFNFCDDIKNDADEGNEIKACWIKEEEYHYYINKSQRYAYRGNLRTDLMRLFTEYKKNGFVAEDAVNRYEECKYLFHYSHMEQQMEECIERMGFTVIREYSFTDLKSANDVLLRFDGMIRKDSQMLLVECQGPQHYQPISFFGGEEDLKTLHENDERKKTYCKEHEIPLLCIRYDQNIERKLYQFINANEYSKFI